MLLSFWVVTFEFAGVMRIAWGHWGQLFGGYGIMLPGFIIGGIIPLLKLPIC